VSPLRKALQVDFGEGIDENIKFDPSKDHKRLEK